MTIVYPKAVPVSPGLDLKFGVIAQKGDRKIATKGYGNGNYSVEKYHVSIENGLLKDGVAELLIDSTDNRELNRFVKIRVSPIRNPLLADSVLIPFNYEGRITWHYHGDNGEDGDSKGVRLVPIRVMGTAVSDGRDGDSATSGEHGEDLNVYVQKIMDDSFYARNGHHVFAVTVKTAKGDHSRFAYVAEKVGSLSLICNGGNGGNGGDGGPGVDGLNADDRKVKWPGNGTDGGDGGKGGDGGDGGDVYVFADSLGKEFMWYLNVQNQGGLGGLGGSGGAAGRGGYDMGGNRAGSDGSPGRAGSNGTNGRNGKGPEAIIRN